MNALAGQYQPLARRQLIGRLEAIDLDEGALRNLVALRQAVDGIPWPRRHRIGAGEHHVRSPACQALRPGRRRDLQGAGRGVRGAYPRRRRPFRPPPPTTRAARRLPIVSRHGKVMTGLLRRERISSTELAGRHLIRRRFPEPAARSARCRPSRCRSPLACDAPGSASGRPRKPRSEPP